ncbi:Uncharacterised protein [uncultured archaeon]|nr:Uncharacterised protein [uncultured archaeon]
MSDVIGKFQIKFSDLNETQRKIIELLNEKIDIKVTSKEIADKLEYNPQYVTQTINSLRKLNCPVILIREKKKAYHKLMRKIEIEMDI